ncbi:MAG: hypothetical protein JRJ46_09340 [Deltaproteobacteria bacterium]|nr:hypothetical protein [Deltaproteobacteria bacterium]
MLNGISAAISAIKTLEKKLNVTANNTANVNTQGDCRGGTNRKRYNLGANLAELFQRIVRTDFLCYRYGRGRHRLFHS